MVEAGFGISDPTISIVKLGSKDSEDRNNS